MTCTNPGAHAKVLAKLEIGDEFGELQNSLYIGVKEGLAPPFFSFGQMSLGHVRIQR